MEKELVYQKDFIRQVLQGHWTSAARSNTEGKTCIVEAACYNRG